MRRALAIGLVCALSAAWPRAARADDEAAAEALFLEGRKLADGGNWPEACEKFAASQRASPGAGTLLNLGDCYEHLGKTASAWVSFRNSLELAERAGRPDRAAQAKERIAIVEPKLARLKVTAKKRVAGLTLKRDGQAIGAGALDVAIPVDPGDHVVEAAAPGVETWKTSVTLVAGETTEVEVPVLAERDAGASSGDGPPLRPIGYAVGSAGVIGVVVGTVFALSARSKWDEAQRDHCRGTVCDRVGGALASDAKSSGNVATVAFVLGGVALAAGATLIVLGAPSDPRSARLRVGPGSALVEGTF
jgi:tetratricopeptide (TPR) repeat protein